MSDKEFESPSPNGDWEIAKKLVVSSEEKGSPSKSPTAPGWYEATGGSSKTWLEEVFDTDIEGNPILGPNGYPRVKEYKLQAVPYRVTDEDVEKAKRTVAVIKPDGTFDPSGKRIPPNEPYSTTRDLLDQISAIHYEEEL